MPTPATNGTSTRIEPQNDDGVYSSPAFVKRARTSYGSLFELDPFADEDGTVKSKGRKRTRLSSTWTYTSRSPTPEADVSMEEQVVIPPVENPKPVMMDEGCQTIGLEIGDAAESLANFSRQAMNVGGISYAGLQPEFGNNSIPFNTNGNHIQPPSIQTDLVEQNNDPNGDTPHIPRSPKLQPLSSDSLPLVSPLISRGFSMHSYQPTPNISELGQTPDAQQSITANLLGENGNEDLYNASPVAMSRGELAGAAGFDTTIADINGLQTSQAEAEFNLSSQPTAILSHHSQSPFGIPGNSTEIPDDDAFGIGERRKDRYDLADLQDGQVSVQNLHGYPDLEGFSAPIWTSVPTAVGYPDLPERMEADNSVHSQQRYQSTAMSRSQSARSQQSQVVNLTESDDEDDAHGEPDADDESVEDPDDQSEHNLQNLETHRGHYLEQDPNNVYEGSQDEGEITENEYTEDDERQLIRKYPDQSGEEFEDEEEMEDFEDDNGYTDNERYNQNLYPQQFEDEDEDEEGSYDDDESMVGEAPCNTAPQAAPVVIDLLSSDDEDDSAPPPKATTALYQAEPQTHEEADEEESDSDVGIPGIRSESDSGSSDRMEAVHGEVEELNEDIEQESASGSGNEDAESEPEEMDLVPTTALPDDPHAIDTSYGAMPHEVEGAKEEVIEGEIEEDHSEGAIIDEETADRKIEQLSNGEVIVDEEVAEEELQNERAVTKDEISDSEEQSENVVTEESPDLDEGPIIDDVRDYEEATEVIEVTGFKTTDEEEPEQNEDDHSSEAAVGEIAEADAMEADETELQEGIREVSEEIEEEPQSGPASAAGNDEAMEIQEAEEMVEEPVENAKPEPQHVPQDVNNDADEMDFAPPALDDMEESVVNDTTAKQHNQEAMSPRTRKQKDNSRNSKMLGLDGAYDTSPKRTRRGRKNVQLPTPDDTQVSQNMVSTDVSFTNISQSQEAGEEPEAGPEVTTSKAPRVDKPELPPSFDTDEALLDESTVIEKIVQEAEAVAMDEVSPPDEATVIERIVEEAKATALESMSPQSLPKDEVIATEEEPTKTTPKKPTGKKRAKPLPEPTTAETTTVAPRRSHRRDASQNRPKTPTKSSDKNHASSSIEDSVAMVVVEQQFSPMKGHDASVELALDSLQSPSKQRGDAPQSAAETKVRLARALRTELEEFTSLKVVRYHLNAKLDFLAIVTTTPPEPNRTKLRQYQMTFNVTDQSIAPNSVIEVQVSRPHRDVLPIVKVGDGILLRQFKIIAAKNRGFALCADHNNETASWAVFKGDVDEEPEIRGPPVEFGDGEREYIASMKTWYHTLDEDETAKAKLERANAALADSSPAKKGASR